MAILQSRVIALINAGLDYRKAYRQLVKSINNEANSIARMMQTPEGAMQNLSLIANSEALLEDPIRSEHVLTAEHFHFHKNLRRNEWNRQYQENKRRDLGIAKKKIHYEPVYAQNDLSSIGIRTTPQPTEGQNRYLGNIQSKTQEQEQEIIFDSPEQEREYNNFIKRREEEETRRNQPLEMSDTIVDINFPPESQKEVVIFTDPRRRPKKDLQEPKEPQKTPQEIIGEDLK